MKRARDRIRGGRHTRLLAGAGLLLGTVLTPAAGQALATATRATTGSYAGWAMDAYPGDSVAILKAEMTRQIKAGANVVWLGHNNPGEVDIAKGEPGLSYAVWAAYRDPAAARHRDAVAMVQAVEHALDAARALSVRVVLPVGYQIQMGQAWNHAHPNDMRRGADGKIYEHGDTSAAYQSPTYRHDILAYYRWVDATFVHPYAASILMLNLADEPADGDYSAWSDRAFRARYGYGLRDAGGDPVRQQTLGRYQSEYIAEYAAWSSSQWQRIDPTVKVTMSFCGGYGRYMHEGPDLEAIFRRAPPNFVVTFDAYPRDGLYNTPLRQGDLTALFALVRTLGHYSAVYNRSLWLWSTANSWGLNGASNDPGNIADAVANSIYLAQLANQGGANLQGIAVWNYNIKGQGLFNDTHHVTYDPNQMFARVSASFPLLRAIMTAPPGRPDTAVLAPNDSTLRAAGAELLLRAVDSYDWTALSALARDDIAAPVLTHLFGETLPDLRTVIVLARTPGDLAPSDRSALLTLLGHGGTVVAGNSVAQLLAGTKAGAGTIVARGGKPVLTVLHIATAHGTLLVVDGGSVEHLFDDSATSWAGTVERCILHHPLQQEGYLVAAGGMTLLYSGLARPGATIQLPGGAGQNTLTLFNPAGAPRQVTHLAPGNTIQRVFLPRRTFALLTSAAT